MNLGSPLTGIKGVGTQTADKLRTLGLETVEDLLYFLPRKYSDFSKITHITDVSPGNVTLQAKVEAVVGRYVRRRLHITEAILDDGTAKTKAVWFNQPYRAEQLTKGDEFYFSGPYELQRSSYVLSNPSAERVADFSVSTARIVPVYPETKGLKSFKLRQLIKELVPIMRMLPETLPAELIKHEKLMSINDALYQLHFPDSTELLARAKERMAFEEVTELMTASQLNKQDNAKLDGYHIPFDKKSAMRFIAGLPFAMTDAQKRAVWEVCKDFEQAVPMNRLLQGDVGSGKTVVAAMAGYMAIQSALIQKNSQFRRLGLVVVDEQHRFGVKQRAELLGRSERMPHLLSMTATPIPRSLQLTLYGELEVSILDELPKGRLPIITRLFSGYGRKQFYGEIDKQLSEGRQAYVVCPVIGEGLQAELKSVEQEFRRLKNDIFPHRKLAKLHGKMKAGEKEDIMRGFKDGEFDILVATTVVEVGVDVPNATIMLIEGAERFGLAQLHQLRGRVGRGTHQSYCYLVPSQGKKPSERLYELERSQDGFYLAEADLRLRGPGEIYGRMQHGALDLRIANLADVKLLKQARGAADWLLKNRINLIQYKQFYKHVARYRGLTSLN